MAEFEIVNKTLPLRSSMYRRKEQQWHESTLNTLLQRFARLMVIAKMIFLNPLRVYSQYEVQQWHLDTIPKQRTARPILRALSESTCGLR